MKKLKAIYMPNFVSGLKYNLLKVKFVFIILFKYKLY